MRRNLADLLYYRPEQLKLCGIHISQDANRYLRDPERVRIHYFLFASAIWLYFHFDRFVGFYVISRVPQQVDFDPEPLSDARKYFAPGLPKSVATAN